MIDRRGIRLDIVAVYAINNETRHTSTVASGRHITMSKLVRLVNTTHVMVSCGQADRLRIAVQVLRSEDRNIAIVSSDVSSTC